MDVSIRTIKAAELVSGMAVKRGLYDKFDLVTRVRTGCAYTTYDLADGSHHDVRNITVVEVAHAAI